MKGERIFVGGLNEAPRELSEEETETLNQRRKYIKIFESIKNNDNSVKLAEWEIFLYKTSMGEGMTAEEWADLQIEREKKDQENRNRQTQRLKRLRKDASNGR